MKKEKSLLIAIVHSIQEPWLTITKNGQQRTWLSNTSENVSIVHFYAKKASPTISKLDGINEYLRWRAGRRIGQVRNLLSAILLFAMRKWIPRISQSDEQIFGPNVKSFRIHALDMYQTSRWRRLAAIDYFIRETDAEYLLLTTSSSYVQPELLLKKLDALDSEFLYAGTIIDAGSDGFVSGAQTILNRNAAKVLLANRKRIPVSLLDDVGLGRTFRKLCIPMTGLSTMNISTKEELDAIPLSEIKDNHHFRLKSYIGKTRNDVALFTQLHKRLSIENDK